MPPEILEKLLSKLDQVDPISKEDLLKAILGEKDTGLDISKEIKKVISNIDALAELEVERMFQKVDEKISNNISNLLTKLDQSIESESKKIFLNLQNIGTSLKAYNRLEKTLEQINQRFTIDIPKIEPVKIKAETFNKSPFQKSISLESKYQEFEISLSKNSIKDLKKIFDGKFEDSFKALGEITEKGDNKLNNRLLDLSKNIRGESGFLDLFGLATLGRMLKPIAAGLLSAATIFSLFAGSFGKVLTSTIDNAFGTNLQMYTRVFQKYIMPVQETDFFTKWSTRLLASKAFGAAVIDTVSPALSKIPLIGGTLGSLYRMVATTLTGKNVVKEGSKKGIEVAGKNVAQATANAAQAAKYSARKAELMRGVGFQRGLTEAQAIEKLAAEGVEATAPTLTKQAAKGGGLLAGILSKFGIKAGERFLTKIPFGVGALFGLGFGAKRIMDGDYVSGILQIASGIASIFPGIGTVISLGLDVLDIGLEVGAKEWKKSTNKFLWAQGLQNFPIFNFLRNVGYHLNSGRPWLAVIDIARLIPGMKSTVDMFETLLTQDVEKEIVAGKPPDFKQLGQMVRKNMWKVISPYIPEMWGMKKWFAEASGLTDEEIQENNSSSTPPVPPVPSAPPENQEASSIPQPRPQPRPTPRPTSKSTPKPISMWNAPQQNFSADENYNKINASMTLEDSSKDFKNYMASLNTAVFNLSNNFKDLSFTLKESSNASSIVNIDNSSQNSGGGYISSVRDEVDVFRRHAAFSLNNIN